MECMGTIGKEAARPRVFRTVVIGLGVCVLGALASAGGCIQQPTQLQPDQTSSGSTSGSSSGGEAVENPGRTAFDAMQADLMQACGMCHDIAGLADTPFLAGPDRYQSFVSWPGIVASTPEQSILLTHSMTGKGHVGTNLDSPALVDTLLPKVKAWLAEEAKTFVQPPQQIPHIEPFAPIIGFNAVYLEPLGQEFRGMAVTFSAELLSDNVTLQLSNIQVHPTSKAGVHIVHPLFVMHPVKGEPIPDPIDSFSGLDQTFDIGKSGTLSTGEFIFVNWQKDARLSLAFEKIELVTPPMPDAGPDGGTDPMGGCKDVAAFDANARGPLQQRCSGCHGGGNGQATAAVDMSALGSDVAKACAQVRNRVNPGDPPASQIFVTTNPDGNAAHPYKFGGNAGTFDTFRNGVSNWIAAEQ